MAHTAHLYQRDGTFYFWLRIPIDLKRFFQREELKRSLRTKSLTAARRMVNLWNGKTEGLFVMMRSGMLSNTQIKQLVEDYIAYTLQRHDEERVEAGAGTSVIETNDGPTEVADRMIHNPEYDLVLSEMEDGRSDYVSKRLDEFLVEVNVEIDKESTQYKQLCRDVGLAHINKIQQIDCQRDMNDFSDPYYLSEGETQTQTVLAPPIATQGSQPKNLLSDTIDKYIKDKASGGSASKESINEYASTCKRFVWILGDRGIESYTRDDLRTLVDTVKRLPKNLNKNALYRDKSLKAVLAMKPEVTISTKTINEHIRLLRAVFDWAENEGWITSNPSKVISFISEGKRTKEKARERYTHEDLKKMTDSLHDEAASGRLKGRAERFLIPLIAMFSGMRLNEICQLQISDVNRCNENNHWFFDVNETEGVTTVKTAAGRRKVPIHPVLIDLVFIEYFRKIRASGATQVWPKLKQTQRGYRRALDNWFNGSTDKKGFNRRCVTDDPKKTFHSTRHSFRNELKQLRVDKEVAAEIVGHAYVVDESVTYTDDLLVQIKLEALQKVNYGLDLGHLKPLAKSTFK